MVACALVVLVHVNVYTRPGVSSWWPGGTWFAPIFGLTVPVFFLLAGYVADTSRLRARLLRLVPPFLAWNAVMIALGVGADEPVWTLLTGSWHLYFICALLQLLVLHALAVRFVSDDRWGWVVGLSVAATALLFGLSEAQLAFDGGDGGAFEDAFRKLGPVWGGFFFLGTALKRDESALARVRTWGALTLLSWPLYVWELQRQTAWLGTEPRLQLLLGALPFQLFGGLFALGLLERLARTSPGRRLGALAGDTFGIYLMHNAALVLWYGFLGARGWTSVAWWETPLVWALVWVSCTVVTRLLKRLPVRFLVGVSSRAQ